MSKFKHVKKPNMVRLSVNAKCHHGIRHPTFLKAKFNSKQRKRAKQKRQKGGIKSPRSCRKSFCNGPDILTTCHGQKHFKPSDTGMKSPSDETLCDCQENSLSSQDFETFTSGEMLYDSFLDSTVESFSGNSDTDGEDEPLHRRFNASVGSSELIIVNGTPNAEKIACEEPEEEEEDNSSSDGEKTIVPISPQDFSPLREDPAPELGLDAEVERNGDGACFKLDSDWEDVDTSQDERIDKAEPDISKNSRQQQRQSHRIYSQHADSFIMVLDHPTRFSMLGTFQVRLLWGCLMVNGYCLKPDHQFTPIYSPAVDSSIVISTHQEADETGGIPDSQCLELLADNDEIVNEFQAGNNVGLQCKQLLDKACSYVTRFFPRIFHADRRESGIFSNEKAIQYGCQFYDVNQSKIQFTNSDKHWREIVSDISASMLSGGIPPRILICGGKGLGKSTLCRYILNSLLNACDKVYYLDADPGQCEFTPHGLVSLTEVSEPCLGPAFTHHKTPKISLFVGGANVSDSPSHYVRSISCLWQNYSQANSRHSPLIINTMGWNRGMGLALLMDLIHITQPNFLIQINSPKHLSRNCEPLSVENVSGISGWEFGFPEVKIQYAHYIIKSLSKPALNNLSAVQMRLVNLLSYFSQFQQPQKEFLPVNHLHCIKIAWSTVALHVCHVRVLNSQILYVYNASIVALCKCDSKAITSSADATLPKFIREMPVCEFFGYGIVRGISMEEKCFYLITHLAPDKLTRVNAMIKGSISVPQQLLLEQDVGGPIPYLVKREVTSHMELGHKSIPKRIYKSKTKMMLPIKGKPVKTFA